jgi:hypothetical protein
MIGNLSQKTEISPKTQISPKKEISDFITFINDNCVKLDECTTNSLKNIIKIWKTVDSNKSVESIYLDNLQDYYNVTDFVRKKQIINSKEEIIINMTKLWILHVAKITSQKLGSKEKNDVSINIAHHEFKLKMSEKYEKLFPQEKAMLDFYRKVAIISILSNNHMYMDKPLIDKLILNCRIAPFSGIQCKNIQVRQSELLSKIGFSENGVFATDEIQAGTIVTFYPVDGYCDDDSNNYHVSDGWVHENGVNMEDHSCSICDNLKIVADPSKINNPMLLGHMINDSVGNTFKGTTTCDIENGIYEYYIKSNNNCKLKINEKYGIIYVVTTRTIEKDEELTFSYGPLYWFSRVDSNTQHFYDVCNDKKVAEFMQQYFE